MDPLAFVGALVSAGVNLFSADRSAKQAANQYNQNMQLQSDLAYHGVERRVQDAKAAGINPLAALGMSSAPMASVVGGHPEAGASQMGQAGQDLGRAVAAVADKESRTDQLNERLLELKIKGAEADITHQQLLNSGLAKRLAQPGTPPGVPGIPFPREDPRGPVVHATQRIRTDSGEIITVPSAAASQALQNIFSAPGGVPVAVELTRANVGNAARDLRSGDYGFSLPDWLVRPDIGRGLSITGGVP
jgi:hypothetical protein